MSEQYLVNTVRSYSAGTVGRSMNTVRNHHFIIDSPTIGEEITSGDAFLAGVSSCGVTLVERAAEGAGIPLHADGSDDRGAARSTIAYLIRADRHALPVRRCEREQAEWLVGRYKDG